MVAEAIEDSDVRLRLMTIMQAAQHQPIALAAAELTERETDETELCMTLDEQGGHHGMETPHQDSVFALLTAAHRYAATQASCHLRLGVPRARRRSFS